MTKQGQTKGRHCKKCRPFLLPKFYEIGGNSCKHCQSIKTKRLIETAEMEYAELMYEMYAEPETSYGDITRYFTEKEIQVLYFLI